jgi:hypothetical protein
MSSVPDRSQLTGLVFPKARQPRNLEHVGDTILDEMPVLASCQRNDLGRHVGDVAQLLVDALSNDIVGEAPDTRAPCLP